jgi:L-aspartate oxidase
VSFDQAKQAFETGELDKARKEVESAIARSDKEAKYWSLLGRIELEAKRLERALHRLELIRREIQEYYHRCIVTPDLLELRNLSLVAELVIRCAMARKESRGLHYTLDYPTSLPVAQDTVLRRE